MNIKPLHWTEGNNVWSSRAWMFPLSYKIRHAVSQYAVYIGQDFKIYEPTLEAAKMHCQADFAKRVWCCLEL